MDWFYLQPFSLLALTQAIIAFFITLYFLRLPNKSKASWMLTLIVGAFAVFWAINFIDYSESDLMPLPISLNLLDGMMIGVILFGFLHFSYAFLGDPFQRESKILLVLSSVFVGIHFTVGLYQTVNLPNFSDEFELFLNSGYILIVSWSTLVLLRKYNLLSKATESPPKWLISSNGREKPALKAFALLTFCIVLLLLPGLIAGADSPPAWVGYVEYLGQVSILVAFVVIYINHTSEPITFLLKLTGLSLTTLLVVLGIASMMLFPNAELVLYNNPGSFGAHSPSVPQMKSMRFIPNEEGGYNTAFLQGRFIADMGDDLGIGVEGDSLVKLDFSFRFYDEEWNEVYVDANGLVSFGEAYRSTSFQGFFDDKLPKIAPCYRALIPRSSDVSGVYYKSEPDYSIVTWYRVRERYAAKADNENTFQLILHKNGNIDFVYDHMEASPLYGFRGIRPGGDGVKMEQGEFASPAGSGIAELIIAEGKTIRFDVTDNKIYQHSVLPSEFDPELGEELRIRNRDEHVDFIGFPFPFFKAFYDSIFIADNGIIAFEKSLYPRDASWFDPHHPLYSETPIIAPFFVDLIPTETGKVYIKRQSERLTITWNQIPVLGQLNGNTVQLVLHRTGSIDFTYQQIAIASFAVDLWGLYPGSVGKPYDANRFLTSATAFAGLPGAGLYENFNKTRGLALLQYRHEQMLPFFYVIIGSTLFILLIFPLLFRISLIWPLNALLKGVRQVDSGDLNASVEVQVNDEIGILADNFNKMTASLRAAEEQLTAYAEGLEGKVAERTADLQKTLNDLTETQNKLIHAEKMASLGQMTAGIAHEIKNPLNFVNNFAHISVGLADELVEALEKGESVDEVLDVLKENAVRIKAHGKRAVDIVHEMMHHASVQSDKLVKTNVNHLVSTGIDLASRAMQKKYEGFVVDIHLELGAEVGELEVIPQGLSRVIENLLSNAFDAVQQRSGSEKGYSPEVWVKTDRKETHIEIQIVDNGQGVADDIREKIFEPFFTTKPTGSGIGLGLSLAYDIVSLGHGGTLSLIRDDGENTVFSIVLPIDEV